MGGKKWYRNIGGGGGGANQEDGVVGGGVGHAAGAVEEGVHQVVQVVDRVVGLAVRPLVALQGVPEAGADRVITPRCSAR